MKKNFLWFCFLGLSLTAFITLDYFHTQNYIFLKQISVSVPDYDSAASRQIQTSRSQGDAQYKQTAITLKFLFYQLDTQSIENVIFWTNNGKKALGLLVRQSDICLAFGQNTLDVNCFYKIDPGQWYDMRILLDRESNITIVINNLEVASFMDNTPYQIKNIVIGGAAQTEPLLNGVIKNFSISSDFYKEDLLLNYFFRFLKIISFTVIIFLLYWLLFGERKK